MPKFPNIKPALQTFAKFAKVFWLATLAFLKATKKKLWPLILAGKSRIIIWYRSPDRITVSQAGEFTRLTFQYLLIAIVAIPILAILLLFGINVYEGRNDPVRLGFYAVIAFLTLFLLRNQIPRLWLIFQINQERKEREVKYIPRTTPPTLEETQEGTRYLQLADKTLIEMDRFHNQSLNGDYDTFLERQNKIKFAVNMILKARNCDPSIRMPLTTDPTGRPMSLDWYASFVLYKEARLNFAYANSYRLYDYADGTTKDRYRWEHPETLKYYNEALDAIHKAYKYDPSSIYRLTEAEILAAMMKRKEALAILSDLLKKNPDDLDALAMREGLTT